MIQVLDAELEVQAVVNACRQLVNTLLVNAVDGIERQVIADVLQLVGCLDFLLALEHAHILAVVQNTNNLLVLCLYNSDVLQHLVHLRLAKGNSRRLRLQNKCDFRLVVGQIPAVWLISNACEPKLIERRELPDTGARRIAIYKPENVTRQIAYRILRQILCHLFVSLLYHS